VLIATLATLLLSSGLIVTAELLSMTAPGAGGAVVSKAAAATAETAAVPAREPNFAPPTIAQAATPEPVPQEAQPQAEPAMDEIEQLATMLRESGKAAHKVTVLGTASGDAVTLTALALARLIARDTRVVIVDLAASSPILAAVSVDPNAPGLAELMQGEASFSQVISRDRLSRAQIVNAGRPGFDRALLQSPRLALAIDALLRVYDHVLLDAGTASDLPAELLTTGARAVVVPEASMDDDSRALMCDQLRAAGFSEVDMLREPARLSDVAEVPPRVVAA
jgi:Mrp family chromosome partitioning ATPase